MHMSVLISCSAGREGHGSITDTSPIGTWTGVQLSKDSNPSILKLVPLNCHPTRQSSESNLNIQIQLYFSIEHYRRYTFTAKFVSRP